MKKNVLLVATSYLLLSCAASVKPVIPKRDSYITVELNQSLEKEIGESLISQGDQEIYDGMKIISVPNKQIWSEGSYVYQVGEIYPLLMTTKEHKLYFHKSSITESKSYYKGTVYTSFSFYGITQFTKHPERIVPFTRQTTGALGGVLTKRVEGFLAEPHPYINIKCENCFKREIVYNGKVGNSLKFMYREYVEDLARPAFTQELQYDLSESNIVGFKGLRIEVIEANNTRIKYKVLKSFEI